MITKSSSILTSESLRALFNSLLHSSKMNPW